MNTAPIESATGRLEYQTPRLVAYGALAAITGTLQCSHFDKVGRTSDFLTEGNSQLDGDIICDP
jgi:hypothetical protein